MTTREGVKMAAQKNKPKVYIKFKRSSTATKVALCVAVGVSVIAMIVIGAATANEWNKADAWRDQAAQLEQENSELEDKIDNLGSLEGLEDIAQQEGLEYPGTIIIDPSN